VVGWPRADVDEVLCCRLARQLAGAVDVDIVREFDVGIRRGRRTPAVEGDDGGAGWTSTTMNVERHVAVLPAGERLSAAVATNGVLLASEVEARLGQLGRVDGPRHPAGPQKIGPASDSQLVHVAAIRI